MPAFLLSLLAGLPGMLGQYFSAKSQEAIARINAQIALSADATALATVQLQSTSQRFKEWMIVILFAPLGIAILVPEYSVHMFNGLRNLPDGYLQECFIIFNTVFGVTVATSTVSKIIDKISTFSAIKNGAKVEIAKINNAYNAYKGDQ